MAFVEKQYGKVWCSECGCYTNHTGQQHREQEDEGPQGA